MHGNCRVASIARPGSGWRVETERGEPFEAPLLVNAAGAWADAVARMAGVSPIGLQPMRRTIIVFDAPDGVDIARLPFTKTVGDEVYFGPESGGASSPRRWTRSRPTRATRSPRNMKWRWPRTASRSGRRCRCAGSSTAGPGCAPSRRTACRQSASTRERRGVFLAGGTGRGGIADGAGGGGERQSLIAGDIVAAGRGRVAGGARSPRLVGQSA